MTIATPTRGAKRALRVADIEGIGKAFADTLRTAGVRTTTDLLDQGATRTGRRRLAGATGLGRRRILEWVDRADLYRIRGIGPEYSDLLATAGVDTVLELAQRDPAHLAAAVRKTATEHPDTVRRVPGRATTARWIERARGLPRRVEY